ncbi:MAG: AbrB/MazE/SpoVT family DNA-binding domain-containing protein [Thermotogae bacterium]|nr:AbrB/MazE/SpoVT family DNA-binding domain-containing protein [Thermotogota bacterium]
MCILHKHVTLITIPAKFRKKLGTNFVEVYMEGDKIVLKPVRKLAGALSRYAFKEESMDEIMKKEKEVARSGFTKK